MPKYSCLLLLGVLWIGPLHAQNELKTQPQPQQAVAVEPTSSSISLGTAGSASSWSTPSSVEMPEEMPATTLSWEETEADFGKIKQGEVARHTFRLTNTGDHPLVIERVKPSCGCTTPEWTQEPIAPGEQGEISVEFDSAGKTGMQRKTITVFTNTEQRAYTLRFNGEIVYP